jgi:hypothetical protein
MKSELIAVRLTPAVARELGNLAGAANQNRAEFIRYWLGGIARLKREHATRAFAHIPLSCFKGLPGRPADEEPDTPEEPAH